ncbi:hypothetical protein J437_LFUL004645 [Ladona fulva]|uniref:Uncharacterized protein n=1 Tax=Ladona fulva TaxID=123851 RepID=A0A8K0NYZ4_LADFU|nr:hypothetical protein J437_LFUL004645 [Ladona fulva]
MWLLKGVDNVEHPSWQAQLRGSKKWFLEPPPECYYHCNRIEVTVEKGEINGRLVTSHRTRESY